MLRKRKPKQVVNLIFLFLLFFNSHRIELPEEGSDVKLEISYMFILQR
jgi:hypothetical protein